MGAGMKRMLCIGILLLVPLVAQAELFVCGTTTNLRTSLYADPTAPAAQAPDCFMVDPQNTALMTSQRTLLATVPLKHLKVVGGLAVEWTAQEKADLAAAEAAAAAARQVFIDEVEAVGKCKFATFEEFEAVLATRKANRVDQLNTAETAFKADVATLTFTTIGNAVTNIRAKLDALATRSFNIDRAIVDELYLAILHIGRCDFARAKVSR